MAIFKDRGLILLIKQLKEADKLVILWSPTKGRLALLAKGANKIKSRKSSSLDLLNLINFSAYGSKLELELLTEVELENDFKKLKTDLSGISLSFYILEVLGKFINSNQSYENFFDFVKTDLNYLESDRERRFAGLLIFQLKTLEEFGYLPELDKCLVCHEKLISNELRIISPEQEAGYLCGKHFDNIKDNFISVPDQVIKVQRFLLRTTWEELDQLVLSKDLFVKIFNINNHWLENVLNIQINTGQLLNSLT